MVRPITKENPYPPLEAVIRARQQWRRPHDASKGERCQAPRCSHLDGPDMEEGSDVYVVPKTRTYLDHDLTVCWACAGQYLKIEEVDAANVVN
jgi:hypothetical protein